MARVALIAPPGTGIGDETAMAAVGPDEKCSESAVWSLTTAKRKRPPCFSGVDDALSWRAACPCLSPQLTPRHATSFDVATSAYSIRSQLQLTGNIPNRRCTRTAPVRWE